MKKPAVHVKVQVSLRHAYTAPLVFVAVGLFSTSSRALPYCGNFSTLDMWSSPSTTNSQSFTASSASVNVGLTNAFGGIGTQLSLTNNAVPNSTVNLINPSSAAGSAWQNWFIGAPSYNQGNLVTDTYYVANQAAGNAIGYQWGDKIQVSGLNETDWAPLYYDHYHPNENFNDTVPLTPCGNTNTDFFTDYGQLNLSGMVTENEYGSKIVHMTNAYLIKSVSNESWQQWTLNQSMALNPSLVANNNPRFYFVGQNRSWLETATLTAGTFNNTTHHSGSCNGTQCSNEYSALSYMVMVVNVGGEDFAMAVHRTDNAPFTLVFSYNTSSNWAGFGVWMEPTFGPQNFTAGQVRSYSVDYEIGSVPEISSLGFGLSADPVVSKMTTTSVSSGQTELFATYYNNELIMDAKNNSSWGAWSGLGGYIPGGLSSVSSSPGSRWDVFYRGGDHQIWHNFGGSSGSGVEALSGSFVGTPSVISLGAGSMDLFAVSSAGHLMHDVYGSGGWSGWTDLNASLNGAIPVVTGSPKAVATNPYNRWDVFYYSGTNLWHVYWQAGQSLQAENLGNPWPSYPLLFNSDPEVISLGANWMDLFINASGLLYHQYYSGGRWSGWQYMEGWGAQVGQQAWVSGQPHATVTVPGSRWDLVYRAGDQTIEHLYWQSGMTSPFASQNIGQTAVTSPVIHSSSSGYFDVYFLNSSAGLETVSSSNLGGAPYTLGWPFTWQSILPY